MAAQSAAQCGPCVVRPALDRGRDGPDLEGRARVDDRSNLERWAGQVRNRGACRHPDGAVGLLVSAFDTFGDELIRHERARSCSFAGGRHAGSEPGAGRSNEPEPVRAPMPSPA